MKKEDVVAGGFYTAVKGNHCEIDGYHCFNTEHKLQFISANLNDKELGNFQCNGIKQGVYYADVEPCIE